MRPSAPSDFAIFPLLDKTSESNPVYIILYHLLLKSCEIGDDLNEAPKQDSVSLPLDECGIGGLLGGCTRLRHELEVAGLKM